MRDTRRWSDIAVQVSMAIIVMDLVLLFIGLNVLIGIEPTAFPGLEAACPLAGRCHQRVPQA
jgi:hypothetical protein